MFKIIYPKRDTTIYERFPNKNTGADQILELAKTTRGQMTVDFAESDFRWDFTNNSRILMDFDVTDISSSMASGDIPSGAKFYLVLHATEQIDLPREYDILASPVVEDWNVGSGFYNDTPQVKDGASWYYKNGYTVKDSWDSGSGEMFYINVTGGGTWNDSYTVSESFSDMTADTLLDITDIMMAWVSGSVDNNGLILRHSYESGSMEFGSLKFYSVDTHTIYIPKLQVFWDESEQYTGSFNNTDSVDMDNYLIYIDNLRNRYYEEDTVKLRLNCREIYSDRVFDTKNLSFEKTKKLLPNDANIYFSIVDSVTDSTIVPFHHDGTKVKKDDKGYYFKLNMNSFLPERYYRILFKIEDNVEGTTEIYDNKFSFGVFRRSSELVNV